MFEPSPTPRVFAMAPGVDFPKALVAGLLERSAAAPPEELARVQLWVNTARMQRRVRRLFLEQGALLLPRIRLITDLANDPGFDIPPAANPLVRKLELAQLVRALIEREPHLASRDAAYDLANSLAALLDEMQDEHVPVEAIEALDVQDHAAHWARSQRFISLVYRYLEAGSELDSQGRQRAIVTAMIARWRRSPPADPILIAGSTGSRKTTRELMEAVAVLPQGALILPGFDTDMTQAHWDELQAEKGKAEDHPQSRYATLMAHLGLTQDQIAAWNPGVAPPSAGRNRMVSLALRPAPVTNAWLEEGPNLQELAKATQAISWVNAPNPRLETLTIAMRLRRAIEDGKTAALITPDQTLSRRVKGALDAWNIRPDDSAGERLDLSPQGRLLRQVAELIGGDLAPDRLLALLKHPLVCAGARAAHLAYTRALELDVLRGGPPEVTRATIQAWADQNDARSWHDWLWELLEQITALDTGDLASLSAEHLRLTEALTAGPNGEDPALWAHQVGQKAHDVMQGLCDASPSGGEYTPRDFSTLVTQILRAEEVRTPYATRRDVMIWGTLEARVQGAELVILAGLNEDSWPAKPAQDSWLNRDMRRKAGLRLPDAKIGLSAHDFQQAIAAQEVVLTRSVRNAEAETVPSRWLNRIENLLSGLPGDGQAAFAAMQARGAEMVAQAQRYDTPRQRLPKAPRPAPQPPTDVRPNTLYVTAIETLIRDPYAIYAKHVLKLRQLKPLLAVADAALRGEMVHKVLQAFGDTYKDKLPADPVATLMQMAASIFEREAGFCASRKLWLGRFGRAAPWFVETELLRRQEAAPLKTEVTGSLQRPSGFALHGRADRVDRLQTDGLAIYDYKTGTLPSERVQEYYNKQLSLLATLTFPGLQGQITQVGFIGLGSSPAQQVYEVTQGDITKTLTELDRLIARYMDPDQGYAARRAVSKDRWEQDYDGLARFGEWDFTDPVTKIRVGS